MLCGSNEEHTGVEILEPPEGSEVGEHLYLDSFGSMTPVSCLPYRGPSLIRNCLLLGPYSRLCLGPYGEGSEVGEHLYLDSFGSMKPVHCPLAHKKLHLAGTLQYDCQEPCDGPRWGGCFS